ncbi:UDP-N-acetylglucosamine 2-epimerase [bacterium]|nr:UDP-N-acetylglucosamine 2-epimerase [bacterium]MBU1598749.1 UDP-N-acetylglucosamine 2-epimerase [bacterium]
MNRPDKLNLKDGEYFLISTHREENVDDKDSFLKLIDSFNALAEKYRKPLIVTTHPRTSNRIKEYGVEVDTLINLHKPFGYFDYVQLQKNAFCVLSDSGTIQEEASLLGFPAVQIRESSERPEAFDTGNVILSGLDKGIILQAVEIATSQFLGGKRFEVPTDYQSTNVSDKVLRLIVGLTGIIKKNW